MTKYNYIYLIIEYKLKSLILKGLFNKLDKYKVNDHSDKSFTRKKTELIDSFMMGGRRNRPSS